jgi:hypothetical protein
MPNSKSKYVTRSAYQKLAEENKRLIKDIYMLTSEPLEWETVLIKKKWKEKFKSDKLLTELLKQIAQEHFKKKSNELK